MCLQLMMRALVKDIFWRNAYMNSDIHVEYVATTEKIGKAIWLNKLINKEWLKVQYILR